MAKRPPHWAQKAKAKALSLRRENHVPRRKARRCPRDVLPKPARPDPRPGQLHRGIQGGSGWHRRRPGVNDRDLIFTHEFGDRCKDGGVIVDIIPTETTHTVQREHHMNRVTLLDRLGKTEIRSTWSGERVANFSRRHLVVEGQGHRWRRKSAPRWHNIVVWGALAGTVERYLQKGKPSIWKAQRNSASGRTRTALTAGPPKSFCPASTAP